MNIVRFKILLLLVSNILAYFSVKYTDYRFHRIYNGDNIVKYLKMCDQQWSEIRREIKRGNNIAIITFDFITRYVYSLLHITTSYMNLYEPICLSNLKLLFLTKQGMYESKHLGLKSVKVKAALAC